MLLTVLFLVLLSNCVLSQGIIDPYTFAPTTCSGNYYWTTWFDTNDPNYVQGDMELTYHIQQLFGIYMCASPIAIEARTSIDTSPSMTGDIFRLSVRDGFLCLNQQVNNYKSKLCNDYKVRYCCPVTTG